LSKQYTARGWEDISERRLCAAEAHEHVVFICNYGKIWAVVWDGLLSSELLLAHAIHHTAPCSMGKMTWKGTRI
jgi:hypothetical protein